MKKNIILSMFFILIFILNFNCLFADSNKTSLREKYEKKTEELFEENKKSNNLYEEYADRVFSVEKKDVKTLFNETFEDIDMLNDKDLRDDFPKDWPKPSKNNNLLEKYNSTFENFNKNNESKFKKSTPILEKDSKWDKFFVPAEDIEETFSLNENNAKNDLRNFDEKLNQEKRKIENKIENFDMEASFKKENVFHKMKDFFTGDFKIKEFLGLQKDEDKIEYKEYFNKYYNKTFASKEQNKQRKKILEVFKEHGIFDRSESISNRFKAADEEFMGKLIKEHEDLLRKEIEDFKSF